MSHAAASCILPEELIQSTKSFEQFYLSRHSGRRLTWQPSLGSADVQVRFRSRKHDLNVSTFALVILLLFQEVDDLTYEVRFVDFQWTLLTNITGNSSRNFDTRK